MSDDKDTSKPKPKTISVPEPWRGNHGVPRKKQSPLKPADFKHWKKADLWTIERGILLLLRIEELPLGKTPEELDVVKEFKKLLELAEGSIKVGKLSVIYDKYYLPSANEIEPLKFLAWARSKECEIPAELDNIEASKQLEPDLIYVKGNASGNYKNKSADPQKLKPGAYISYAWGDDTPKGKQRDEIVDRLCETLLNSGFEVGRDKTHTKPGDSIKEFMQSLSKAPKIIAVISKKYLRSPNCMVYELFPAFRRCDFDRTEFREKVVALVLGDSVSLLKNAFDLKEYWQSECAKERDRLSKADPDRRFGVGWDFVNDAEDMSKNLPNMLEIINDTLMTRGFDEILKTEFSEVIARLNVGNH